MAMVKNICLYLMRLTHFLPVALWAITHALSQAADWPDLTGKPSRAQVLSFSMNVKPPLAWYFIPDRQKANGVLLQYTDAAILTNFLKSLSSADGSGLTELKGCLHARLEGGEWQSWPLAINATGVIHLNANGKAFALTPTFVAMVKTQAPALLESKSAVASDSKSSVPPKGKMLIKGSDAPRLAKPFIPKEVFEKTLLMEFKGTGENRGGYTPRPAFDVKMENFSAWVPSNYTDEEAFGLLVWITPGEGAPTFPQEWQSVFEDKKLIWIGAHETGNKEETQRRARLAGEARLIGLRNFHIDTQRIYASGFSGGGGMISWILSTTPEQWTGTVHFAGVYPLAQGLKVLETNEPYMGFTPEPKAWDYIRKNVRMFLIQGEDDKSARGTTSVLAWGEREHLMMKGRIIPGLAHAVPKDPAIIREAIEFLDLPRNNSGESADSAKLPDLINRSIENLQKLVSTNPTGARQQAASIWERYPEARTSGDLLKVLETLEKWP
jgi:hypothetical protein